MNRQTNSTRNYLSVRVPATLVGLAMAAVLGSGVPAAAQPAALSAAATVTAAAEQAGPAKGAVPASVSDHVTAARKALDNAIARIQADRTDRAITSLSHLRREVKAANAAAIAQIGQPPVDPESDDTPGPPSVLAVAKLDHQVATSVVALFDGSSNASLVHAQRQVLRATQARRDVMLDAVIALPAEGEGADYADGMADTVTWYTAEVTQLTTALDTFVLTDDARQGLSNALTRAQATKAKVDQAFGGGEKALGLVATSSTRFPGDPGSGRMYYGASTEQDLSAWEQRMGQRLALHRTYYRANQVDRLVNVARTDLAQGRMPHVSTKVPGGNWSAVAAGKQDGWLRNLATKLDNLGQPVFLTVHHEPENNANRTTRQPADFVAMQTHVIHLFRVRAPEVTIVPVLQGWSFSKYNRRSHPERWNVPAAKVYGVDVYNPFSTTDARWVPFSEKLDLIRPYAHGRPIVIGEYGTRDDPDNPDRAAQWMRDAFRYARHHNVVSMSYFNSSRNSPDGTWALDGTRAEVFEKVLASSNIARPAAV